MPIYTYTCPQHGTFSDWGTLATSAEPHDCPTCHVPAPRAMARPMLGRSDRGQAGENAFACEAAPSGVPRGGGCGCGMGGCVH